MKSKLKNVLLMGLSLVLVAVIAIGGTVAYLTDTDSDVNVMTLGNVKIAQHEYERNVNDDGAYATIDTVRGTSYELVDFTQAKPLLPTTCENPSSLYWDETNVYFAQLADGEVKEGDMHYYGLMNVFPAELTNVQDKFVFVENTGKTDAYVRTIIAFEAGSCDVAEWDSLISTSTNGFWTYTWLENTVNIDGNNYVVVVCDYTGSGESGTNGRHPDGIVHPGDYTYNNLAQVYMNSKATNEDVKALDGNNNGTYDILVVSQAVQADGFDDATTALDAAFGDITTSNHPWVDGVEIPVLPVGYEVSSDAELAAAVEAGETEIWLNAGTYHAPAAAKGKTLTINGTKDAVLEVVPAGQGEANGQLDYNFDGSTVTFNGITIKTNSVTYAGYARLSGTYNNCVIQNTYNLGTGNSAFYDCEINITNEYLRVGGAYSAIFDGCTFNTDGRAILVFQDGTSVTQTVTVKDCTFNATAAANTWNGIHVAAVSYDGSQGGNYVVNFEGTNTVDSNFNGLWQIKNGADNVTVNGLD